jgi:hypothetical protein
MLKKHTRGPSIAVALLAVATAAHAQPGFEEEFDDKDKPWQEIAIQLPPAPRKENLLPFDVSTTTAYSFAIDAKSLTVGPDGVIRYTLVATSNAGVKNVSYEGIRCESYERKLYAFGQPDGTWSRSRRDQWERISTYATNRQHAALAKDFFCLEKTIAGKAEEMIERIRHNRTLAPQNYR